MQSRKKKSRESAHYPSIDDALSLEEMAFSSEARQLENAGILKVDEFNEMYSVLTFYLNVPMHLDIIKEVVEGLSELYQDPSVRLLRDRLWLTPRDILDKFLYFRSDNDYEFSVTADAVKRLANALTTPETTLLINRNRINPKAIIEEFLESEEDKFSVESAVKNQHCQSAGVSRHGVFKPAPRSAQAAAEEKYPKPR